MKETFVKRHVTKNEEHNDHSRYAKEIQDLQTPCHRGGAFRLSSSKKFAVVKKLYYIEFQACNSKKNDSENYWTIEI